MYCRKCGENNPDNAVYCRNCGEKLIEDVKKTEVIDDNVNYQENSGNTASSSSNSSFGWISCCCIGLILIFILSAIFSGV